MCFPCPRTPTYGVSAQDGIGGEEADVDGLHRAALPPDEDWFMGLTSVAIAMLRRLMRSLFVPTPQGLPRCQSSGSGRIAIRPLITSRDFCHRDPAEFRSVRQSHATTAAASSC